MPHCSCRTMVPNKQALNLVWTFWTQEKSTAPARIQTLKCSAHTLITMLNSVGHNEGLQHWTFSFLEATVTIIYTRTCYKSVLSHNSLKCMVAAGCHTTISCSVSINYNMQFPIKCTGKDDALIWPPSPDLTLLETFSCKGGGGVT